MYAIGWLAVIFIEMIMMSFMDDKTVMVGVLIFTFGLLFLSCLLHGDAASRKSVAVITVYAMVWGGLFIAAPVMSEITSLGDDYPGYVLAIGMGLMFFLIGIYTGIAKFILCRKKVSAIFIEAVAYRSGRGQVVYTPKFSFRYNGRNYCNTSGETHSARKIERKYKNGETYSIYINPKNPNNIRANSRIGGTSLLLMGMGLLFLWFPLVSF